MTRYFIIDEVDHLDRSWLPTGKDVYVIPGNVNVYSRATKKGIKCIAIESHTSQKELDAIARKNEKLCENVCNQYIDLKIPHTVGIDLADLKQAFYPDCKRIIDTATFRLFMLRKFMSTVDDGIVYYFAQGKSEIYNEKSSLSRFAEHIKNEYENIQVYDIAHPGSKPYPKTSTGNTGLLKNIYLTIFGRILVVFLMRLIRSDFVLTVNRFNYMEDVIMEIGDSRHIINTFIKDDGILFRYRNSLILTGKIKRKQVNLNIKLDLGPISAKWQDIEIVINHIDSLFEEEYATFDTFKRMQQVFHRQGFRFFVSDSPMTFAINMITLYSKRNHDTIWVQHGAFGYFEWGNYFNRTCREMPSVYYYWSDSSVKPHDLAGKNEFRVLRNRHIESALGSYTSKHGDYLGYYPAAFRGDWRLGPNFSLPDIIYYDVVEKILDGMRESSGVRKHVNLHPKGLDIIQDVNSDGIELTRRKNVYAEYNYKIIIIDQPTTNLLYSLATDAQIIYVNLNVYDLSEEMTTLLKENTYWIDYDEQSIADDIQSAVSQLLEGQADYNLNKLKEYLY